MLILRRRAGESILIGPDVEIEFLEINSQTVKVGIKAPRDVAILRSELQKVQRQNEAAALAMNLEQLPDSMKSLFPHKSLPPLDKR
jgi:carbon storage regulator